jgi:putative transposase
MPRRARLDIPGVLQHVTVRGISGGEIFLDEEDREDFVRRFSRLLMQTGTECLAWALLPNHGHLLLRPHGTALATFMRRLLTGYAGRFNLRHRRVGRLFQNRYRSVVCEEGAYLLELVRYIHLNPLRARLVPRVSDLDRFRWSGHSVVMGLRTLEGQAVGEVLGRFGRTAREARGAYWHFVAAGVALGRREELAGGGLRRSLARWGRGAKPTEYDERVLGLGEFVAKCRREGRLRDRLPEGLALDELLTRVAAVYDLEPLELRARSRSARVVEARSLFCYLGVARLGYRGTDLGAVLCLGRSGTSKAAERGRKLLLAAPGLSDRVLGPPLCDRTSLDEGEAGPRRE